MKLRLYNQGVTGVAAMLGRKLLDPATMTGSQINRELDRLDRESSKATDELIEAGRGNERISETVQKDDALSQRVTRILDRQRSLRAEIQARFGPGAPGRLPRGFGPRKVRS